jgi:hypothetical protein
MPVYDGLVWGRRLSATCGTVASVMLDALFALGDALC